MKGPATILAINSCTRERSCVRSCVCRGGDLATPAHMKNGMHTVPGVIASLVVQTNNHGVPKCLRPKSHIIEGNTQCTGANHTVSESTNSQTTNKRDSVHLWCEEYVETSFHVIGRLYT